ncbi:MAG: hypothetical protein OEQ28_09235, partial [Acidobacteriota bacterium]|nr:hypothetical protein [Acidobacteriota bacterium]
KGLFTKSNGLKFAALWFIVVDMLLLPLSAIMDGGEIIPFIAIVGFVGAIIIAVMSLFFLENPVRQDLGSSYAANPELASAHPNAEALPAAQMQSAENYAAPAGSWKAADTGDLVRPGSVTEGTTRLLKKEEDSS